MNWTRDSIFSYALIDQWVAYGDNYFVRVRPLPFFGWSYEIRDSPLGVMPEAVASGWRFGLTARRAKQAAEIELAKLLL